MEAETCLEDVCMFCGSRLLDEEGSLTVLPAPWLGITEVSFHKYCPECHKLTPPPPGNWDQNEYEGLDTVDMARRMMEEGKVRKMA